MKATKASTIIIPSAAPIPIPAFAPVDSPEEGLATGVAEGLELLESVFAPELGDERLSLVVVAGFEDLAEFDDAAVGSDGLAVTVKTEVAVVPVNPHPLIYAIFSIQVCTMKRRLRNLPVALPAIPPGTVTLVGAVNVGIVKDGMVAAAAVFDCTAANPTLSSS